MIPEIKKAVEEKKAPDFRGEEGLLYKVSVNDENFWAKKWHRSHTKPFYMPIEAGGSSLSPFWHKAVETSYSLVHELFPSDTINVIGAYDERTKKAGILSSPRFNPLEGRPVTVSHEIQGDGKISAIRDEVLGRMYKVLIAKRDEAARTGATKDQMKPFFDEWRRKMNVEMVRIMGPSIELDSIIFASKVNGPEALDDFSKRLISRDGDNVMADLFAAGISIGHPEVNFIPGPKDIHPRAPYGTFVEFSIADANKLADHIVKRFAGNPVKRAELLQRLRSYQIFAMVDDMFDKIVPLYIHKTGGKFDENSLGQICVALEKFREIVEKFGDQTKPSVLQNAITTIIMQSQNHDEMRDRLQNEIIRALDKALGYRT